MLDARIADLTVTGFKTLVREIMEETLSDLLGDPDEGMELTDEFRKSL